MFYPEEIIEEVRERSDIVSIISSYVKLKKQGSSYVGLCPFHNEKSPSFHVSPDKQMYHCFGCGEGGNVFTFIMKYENYSFPEAVKYLAERAGVTLPEAEYSPEEKQKASMKDALVRINNETGKLYYHILRSDKGTEGLNYLTGRGLTMDTIKKFGLGFTGKNSSMLYPYLKQKGFTDEQLKESGLFTYSEKEVREKFWNRVMFPIMDANGRIIGFGGRVMGDGKPKYLNSPETKLFEKSRNMYGLNFARQSRKDYFIVCEGYMDVIALHQAGFTNAVAALGTSFTSGHASLMKRYVKTVVLSFDSDGAGVKAALRAIPILKETGFSVKCLDMRPYKDPDEFIKALGAEEYQNRIDHARNSFLYEIAALEQQYDRADPEEKTNFYNAVAEKMLEFTDELERANYIEAVANEFQIPFDLLKKTVEKKALIYEGKPKTQPQQENSKKNQKKRDDGVAQSQMILLTWLIDEPGLYQKIKPYICEKDFIDPVCHKVVEMLFTQLEEQNVNPSKIISSFEEEEEQKEVAGLFYHPLRQELSQIEKERVLNDTVRMVKKNYLDYISRNATDISQLQEVVSEQAKLQKMHISL